jgi:hypothetical protein
MHPVVSKYLVDAFGLRLKQDRARQELRSTALGGYL